VEKQLNNRARAHKIKDDSSLILPDRKYLKNERNISKRQKGQLEGVPFKANLGKI